MYVCKLYISAFFLDNVTNEIYIQLTVVTFLPHDSCFIFILLVSLPFSFPLETPRHNLMIVRTSARLGAICNYLGFTFETFLSVPEYYNPRNSLTSKCLSLSYVWVLCYSVPGLKICFSSILNAIFGGFYIYF